MFSRSYAPSFVLEQAANNPTSDSVQLASARSPPQAFAPPTPVAIEDVFGDAQPVEIVMVEELPAPQPEHPFAATSTSTSEPEKRKVRTSTIGRALFPPCELSQTCFAG